MNRLIMSLAFLLSTGFGSLQAQEQYPSHSVQLINPFAAGSTSDTIARIIADQLQTALKQPFVVESRAGAGGNIGATYVAGKAPDGYTLLLGSPPLVTNQFLSTQSPVDPVKQLTPVVLVARLPNVLVVHPSLGVKTVGELIEKARANPGSLKYVSGGPGSSATLSMELFKSLTKTEITAVAYPGAGPAMPDLLSGRVPVFFDVGLSTLAHIQSGALIPIGVSTSEPFEALPSVEPVSKTVPGFESGSWATISAPANTPREVVSTLNEVVNAALTKPDVRERLLKLGADPAGGTPEDLQKFIAAEAVRWKAVIEKMK